VGSSGAGKSSIADLLVGLYDATEGQILIDIVYKPLETPLLATARAHGASVANGVAMLAHQAAVQFELWTGVDAPIEVMLASVASQLG
jgi:shikimate dehydrogenase